MKLEFFELSEDGQHIIAVIDGRRMILSTEKTIADILKMPLNRDVSVSGRLDIVPEKEVSAPAESVGHAPDDTSVESDPPVSDNSNDIQREDLVKLTNQVSGLKDAAGNELSPRQGLSQGAVYRVIKVNQSMVTLPGKDNLTRIINNLEIIDDGAARPERITVLPNEVTLFKKRGKAPVLVTKISEFLKCPDCGENNALVLKGNSFEGKCIKCGNAISVERIIENCTNPKCVDKEKKRNKVALYLYDERYQGSCGSCKTGIEKEMALA